MNKPTKEQMQKFVQENEPVKEVLYCIYKYGQYTFLDDTHVRLITECSNFEALKWVMCFIDKEVDGVLRSFDFYNIVYLFGAQDLMPELDNLMRWPWDERYEKI